MRQRYLLIIGVLSISASLVLGVTGLATGFLGGRGGDIGIARAVRVAQSTAASYPGGGLKADEVIGFSQNYYASLREAGSGIGAFEILIDRVTGTVTREPGPGMMWNTKYSMRGAMFNGGGIMGGSVWTPSRKMTVSAQQAQEIAQRWLDSNRSGSTTKSPDSFYGFYTVDFESSGHLAGMLAVNGYTGQVWYHSWHGAFIQLRDLGA
jgi:hypothetical protein